MKTIQLKQKYHRPAMRVVEMQHRAMLLAGSTGATMNVTYEEEDWYQ